MEKQRITKTIPIKHIGDLYLDRAEFSPEEFGAINESIQSIVRTMAETRYPDASDFTVAVEFQGETCTERDSTPGYIEISLEYDRYETDEEFEERKAEDEEAERRARELDECAKRLRIAEAKKLLEDEGWVVAR